MSVALDGESLTIEALETVAREGATVSVSPAPSGTGGSASVPRNHWSIPIRTPSSAPILSAGGRLVWSALKWQRLSKPQRRTP